MGFALPEQEDALSEELEPIILDFRVDAHLVCAAVNQIKDLQDKVYELINQNFNGKRQAL